jgi:hypothetical protein
MATYSCLQLPTVSVELPTVAYNFLRLPMVASNCLQLPTALMAFQQVPLWGPGGAAASSALHRFRHGLQSAFWFQLGSLKPIRIPRASLCNQFTVSKSHYPLQFYFSILGPKISKSPPGPRSSHRGIPILAPQN